MFIKSIKLRNIRSYENQAIEFPPGSTLLAGDIGSGKSTILLAIEFALFGIRRKQLSGSSLLRHGKKHGEVELKFELEGKEITIKRTLKRGKEDIKQETGYIIIDGIKKEGTHIELKSKIFDLLGYPKELISKSKDIIYRYTVYTPQEQMKQILLEDKDIRLDTLRKLFNIDKYKRIRENAQIYIKELREKKKCFEGQIEDLEEKKREKAENESRLKEVNENLKKLLPKIQHIKEQVNEKKRLVEKKEEQINRLNQLKKQFELEEIKLRNNVEKRNKNREELEKLLKEINLIKEELEKFGIKDIKNFFEKIKEKEKELEKLREKKVEINKKLSEIETKINHSKETVEKIRKIKKCPTCLQDVREEHKKSIEEAEEEKIKELRKKQEVIKKEEEENKKRLLQIEEGLKELRKKQIEVKAIEVKKRTLQEKEEKVKLIEKEQNEIKKRIGEINTKKIKLNEEIERIKDVEQEYRKIKTELDSTLEKEKKVEIEKRELEVKINEITRIVKKIEEEIERKLKIKSLLKVVSQYKNWIEEHFIKLMENIEKHVMLQVYMEFNQLFQQWFNILIEDESLNVRLDNDFTPIIEQNGYETSIENLSGGERTAVALAYRLALNKVVNDVVSQIKTKDILMLDEPTDGFSSEQLDKIRTVLEQLGIRQIIIVSHEPKIESFVDNVIRISKNEHMSIVD